MEKTTKTGYREVLGQKEYAKKYKGHMVDQVTSGFLYCHRYLTFGFDIFYV